MKTIYRFRAKNLGLEPSDINPKEISRAHLAQDTLVSFLYMEFEMSNTGYSKLQYSVCVFKMPFDHPLNISLKTSLLSLLLW